jgi:hypothetical protein
VFGPALKQVFANGRYIVLAVGASLLAFIFTTWLPNLALVWQIGSSDSMSLSDKIAILTALIGSIGTNFTLLSGFTAIAVAVLFGMNVAMIAYLFGRDRELRGKSAGGAAAASIGGVASGLFGIGCAACGTLVLGPVLSFSGASTLIGLLPFGGEEFGTFGIAMLGLSLFLSAKRIGQPITCRTPVK